MENEDFSKCLFVEWISEEDGRLEITPITHVEDYRTALFIPKTDVILGKAFFLDKDQNRIKEVTSAKFKGFRAKKGDEVEIRISDEGN